MEIVIFIGLPGSGKSTFYRTRLANTHEHISKDNFRNAPKPAKRQTELATQALSEGRSVVIDNTNPRREDRQALIQIGRQAGAKIIGYFFDATVQSCIARNNKRTGKDRVPVVAIFTSNKRMNRPALAEGFDELYRVTIAGDNDFEVSKMND